MPPPSSSPTDELQALRAELAAMKGELRVVTVERGDLLREKLKAYPSDNCLPLSNNACENAIRPFTVGRKNWLFYDTVAGANAAANLYSLIETCKAKSVEPYSYLVALFKALPLADSADDYEALLPWHLATSTD